MKRKENKELLLKDLCARLPYKVIVHLDYMNGKTVTREMGIGSLHDIIFDNAKGKPYLRPLSSMTEEEMEELNCLCYHNIDVQDGRLCGYICADEINDVLNYLNAHHFDYRGLIEKGLAIEVTEENNPYK